MKELKFKELPDNGECILDIPEWEDVGLKKEAFRKEPNDITRQEYYNSLINFFSWFVDYAEDVFKGKSFDFNTVVPIVFITKKNLTERQYKDYLHKSLYIAKSYITYLKNSIKEEHIGRYENTILSLFTDLEWLIVQFEMWYKKSRKGILQCRGSRKNLTVTDIFWAIKNLFFIEEVKNIEDLYLRELKPNVMFQIRQMLELMGRSIIGYDSIMDENGTEVKKFTQVAWKFIEERNNKGGWKIEFPLEQSSILHINNWSNSFVHTTYLYSSYLQFYALEALGSLLKPSTEYICIYNKQRHISGTYGKIMIYNYYALKNDFESYIHNIQEKASIKWFNDLKNVGAYIISLS